MKNLCKNRVVIEISVTELMKCRITIGALYHLIKEIKDILNCFGKDEKTLVKRLEKVCYDYRQTFEELEEVEKVLPLLDSLFSYDNED